MGKGKVKGRGKDGQEVVKETIRCASDAFGVVKGNSWATMLLTSTSGVGPKHKPMSGEPKLLLFSRGQGWAVCLPWLVENT